VGEPEHDHSNHCRNQKGDEPTRVHDLDFIYLHLRKVGRLLNARTLRVELALSDLRIGNLQLRKYQGSPDEILYQAVDPEILARMKLVETGID
jgi:hypothetical protein